METLSEVGASLDSEGLHKLQEIFGFEAKDFGRGGAIAVGFAQRVEDQLLARGIDTLAVG